jgi:hypothetical protein
MGQEPKESEILQSLLFTLYLSLFSTVTSTYLYQTCYQLTSSESGSCALRINRIRILRYRYLFKPDLYPVLNLKLCVSVLCLICSEVIIQCFGFRIGFNVDPDPVF